MKKGSLIMVFWSYLLLGHQASASLESVLAPLVRDTPGTYVAAEPEVRMVDEKSSGGSSSQPLVEPGVDELDLLSELETQLGDRLQLAGRLRLIPVSSLPRLPRSVALPEVEIVDHPRRLTSNSVLLRYRLLEGENVLGTYATSFRAQVLATVWVPARRMSQGTPLEEADLVGQEIDIVREPRAVLADEVLVGRFELARNVAPERVLTWTDLVPRSLVHKGQMVEVLASEGSLTISMKGQATRSGALGETITVRNLESKREFPAEVIDEDKVRVHF